MPNATRGMVLSFSRGRARHVAREVIDLEFRLDVEALTAGATMRVLRTERVLLLRELARRIGLLAQLARDLDETDALREAIERTCECHEARGLRRARSRWAAGAAARWASPEASTGASLDDQELAWALALRDLEQAACTRAPRRAREHAVVAGAHG